MANEIAASLQLDLIMNEALIAFGEALLPINLFSRAFRPDRLQGTDKLIVPYYPLEAATSQDFDGTYKFTQGSQTEGKEVTINKRKYQTLSYTSKELARQPMFNVQQIGQQKGRKLAEDVIADIMSVITASNYGATEYSAGNFAAARVLTAAYSEFDTDNVIDLGTMATTQKWPKMERGLILPSSYTGNLGKDIKDSGGIATFGFNPVTGEQQRLPAIAGFSLAESNAVPDNGENLVGCAVYPSAVLVGFAPIEPTPEVAKSLVEYRQYTDPDSGLTIELRVWGDPDSDTTKITMEVNYGYAVGQSEAIIRIKSA